MIELLQFQSEASSTVSDRFIAYLDDPVITGTAKHPRRVPFFQALSSITASGKTVILADATAQVAGSMACAPVVLWLSKGKVVVEQTYANLLPGGKYAHILGDSVVRGLGEYDSTEVAESHVPLVFFATVGTFNQKDKEDGGRLIFRCDIDTAEKSTWDALKFRSTDEGTRRPLIVVYDEAHNLTDQQTDLLLELEPDGFLVASATMRLPPRLGKVVEELERVLGEGALVTQVDPKSVADSGLVKSTVILAGYKTPMEETVDAMLSDMAAARQDAAAYGLGSPPKAIYVCNTNMVATDGFRRDEPKRPFNQREAAPILIWRYLTEQHGIDPTKIATYASLKIDKDHPAPPEYVLFSGGDKDYRNFTAGDYEHVIFNLSLQEGWDDPLAYFAYVDKSMESRVQIEQIIGRLLRQPNASHYPAERLNTAHFYVRVDKNETFNDVLKDVSERLSQEAPNLRVITTTPGKARPEEQSVNAHLEVPATAYDAADAIKPIEAIIAGLSDYRGDTVNTRGQGQRRITQQKVGEGAPGDSKWEEFEQSNLVSARWVFAREVKRLYSRALEVASTSDGKFDARVGLGSAAHTHISEAARQVVEAYVKNVVLVQRKVDPYVVGPQLARPDDLITFVNAAHAGYDGLKPDELAFATAIDKTGKTWARNPSQTGYGIPLISLGATITFYPDFLVWDGDRVHAVDTKGAHLLLEAVGRKLLNIRLPLGASKQLSVRFVSRGKFSESVEQLDHDGFTLWSRREDGTLKADHRDDMEGVAAALLGN